MTPSFASHKKTLIAALWLPLLAIGTPAAQAAPQAPFYDLAQQEKAGMIDTMRDLVGIESGSKDLEGLAQLAALIKKRLVALGGKVELLDAPDIYRMDDTPDKIGQIVHAEFKGSGKRKIMLIAHMDTVYLRGMLKDQPFRVDGDKAYGLGIADDKQGIATILHTIAILQKAGFKDYDTLTVLINGDEEISSPGGRSLHTRFGAEQDVVFSYEGGGADGQLRLATSGIGAAYLNVVGKSSHAGAAPEKGINALYELSHQLLQLNALSQPERGLKLNWTMAQGGTNRNVIPANASAQADARALKVSDFEQLQQRLNEGIKKQLIPDAKVSVKFEMRRPPLEATPASRKLANYARSVYQEIGMPLKVAEVATGGGTDAAFAALKSKGAVIEGMGLSGFGAHSNDAEYVLLDTIVPRLYLSARLIMDVSQDKVK
ncbi:MAG: Carboxypeptidase G2 [Herbaspirillum frisingense]|uniref:Carboxypeptidase G2 n=1 Tax=Herbaspirillum frisingense TaxID=92645 RepID=A0A7V8JVZ3_9BURK|nr:MAG: Carboxypeptidase G2 [Herbaspirillum frisingense]